MPKSFRDMVAKNGMDLSPMVASGGASVIPLPNSYFKSEKVTLSDENGPIMEEEISSGNPSLRKFFVPQTGKEKLKEADNRARQQIKSKESILEGVFENA